MKVPVGGRLVVAWALLVGITVLYLWIDHSVDNGVVLFASTFVTVAAICLACVKVRIIMREFMEVRNAPLFLRSITDVWVILMAVAMIGTPLLMASTIARPKDSSREGETKRSRSRRQS